MVKYRSIPTPTRHSPAARTDCLGWTADSLSRAGTGPFSTRVYKYPGVFLAYLSVVGGIVTTRAPYRLLGHLPSDTELSVLQGVPLKCAKLDLSQRPPTREHFYATVKELSGVCAVLRGTEPQYSPASAVFSARIWLSPTRHPWWISDASTESR